MKIEIKIKDKSLKEFGTKYSKSENNKQNKKK